MKTVCESDFLLPFSLRSSLQHASFLPVCLLPAACQLSASLPATYSMPAICQPARYLQHASYLPACLLPAACQLPAALPVDPKETATVHAAVWHPAIANLHAYLSAS